jgi:hypothetical protein
MGRAGCAIPPPMWVYVGIDCNELGFRNAFLWVLVGNVRAERFYRIDQWVSDDVRRTDSVWGITVNELRYQRGL